MKMSAALRSSVLLLVIASCGAPAAAGIQLTVDRDSLAEIFTRLTAQTTEVSLTQEMRITVAVEDFQIVEIVPAASASEAGWIRARMTVRSPELGLSLTLEPRVIIAVEPDEQGGHLTVRFTDVGLSLPMGNVDLSSLVPQIRYPARMLYEVPGMAAGNEIGTRLTRVEVQPEFVRFHLDVERGQQTTIDP